VATPRAPRGLNKLPDHLRPVVGALLEAFAPGEDIPLDAIGDAIGALKIGVDEIELAFDVIEHEGRTIAKETGEVGAGTKRLNAVIDAGRRLRGKLGRTPTRAEIAKESKLSEDEVQHALALAKVMQR
jgi:DNA-directed RNA polymerase sigma subunit (sigma70/sigma32)